MRISPIEDLNAEGFSTLTTQAHRMYKATATGLTTVGLLFSNVL
ncbi:MAG: hypothetical protein CM1200mP16_07300 [Nitrospina sp.]|nr:MAG: hypothetical protein CM1200mP16_07300 [Nitrospina sp.]